MPEIRIENAGSGNPHGTLGKALGMGVASHRTPRQTHRAADREQFLARVETPPDLLILRQAPRSEIRRCRGFGAAAPISPGAPWRCGFRAGNAGNRWQTAQAAMDAGQPSLNHLAQVLEQVLTIRHLNRRASAQGGATGILGGAVARDHLIGPWPFSHSAKVSAVRSGSRSTTRRTSRSTRMVP